MEIRRRKSPEEEPATSQSLEEMVQKLDAFSKLPQECLETTTQGAGISIVTFIVIGLLIGSEIITFFDAKLKFTYQVDKDHDSPVQINFDITVAMKCDHVGADVVDTTGATIESVGDIKDKGVHFELSDKQAQYFKTLRMINNYLRTEYHAIQDVLWFRGKHHMFGDGLDDWESGEEAAGGSRNACRLRGSFMVNKMAGNFHITAGKSFPMMGQGHAHIAMFISREEYNFSHRINHFSFGEPVAGRVNPLDADEFVTKNNMHMFQYFVKVVPTRVDTRQTKTDTYQFSVTEKNRSIDHDRGSHGVPGIFIKYDISSLKVSVKEEFESLSSFLVRLAAIVGGVFATTGMLKQAVGFILDHLSMRLKVGSYAASPLDVPVPKQHLPSGF